MEYRKCGCGAMVTTDHRFCSNCGRPIEASAPNKMHQLIRSIPFLGEFRNPVPLGSQNGRETFRADSRGADFLIYIADCADSADLFLPGVIMLHTLSRMGFAPPVRHHLHTGEAGNLGILTLEDKCLPSLQDQLRKGELTVADALRACTLLCRALDAGDQPDLPLNIHPGSICLSPLEGVCVNPGIVLLTRKELQAFRLSSYADPDYRLSGEYQPVCGVWSVAMVLHALFSGLEPHSCSTEPYRYTAPDAAPAPLARCLYQALQLRLFASPRELGDALEEVRKQLTHPQLRQRLSLNGIAAAHPCPPAPAAAPSCAPALARSCAPAPAPAQSKKGGLLSRLFGKKEEPPRPAPAPSFTPPAPAAAPIPRPTVISSQPAQPVTQTMVTETQPQTTVITPASSGPITQSILPIDDDPWAAVISGRPDFSQVQPGFCPPAPMPPCAAPAPAMYAPVPQSWAPPPRVDRVQFSAVAPKEAAAGDYAIIQLFMYEQEFRQVVDEALAMADTPAQEKRSGFHNVRENTRVKVVLTCPDLQIDDNVNEQTWCGGYLEFDFALCVPEDFRKRQLMLSASVYFDDIPATRLMLIVKATCTPEASVQVSRQDIFSAFVSYASQDRARVAGLIQGMRKARPEMDIFFDVTTLRSGDDWETTLFREIQRRDVLFLCWSQNARNSPWVAQEWHYALEHKGIGCIEPIPLEPPDVCPPPAELSKKHFNDSLLYISR